MTAIVVIKLVYSFHVMTLDEAVIQEYRRLEIILMFTSLSYYYYYSHIAVRLLLAVRVEGLDSEDLGPARRPSALHAAGSLGTRELCSLLERRRLLLFRRS